MNIKISSALNLLFWLEVQIFGVKQVLYLLPSRQAVNNTAVGQEKPSSFETADLKSANLGLCSSGTFFWGTTEKASFVGIRSCHRRWCCFTTELWYSRKMKNNQCSSALKSKETDLQRDTSSPECLKSRAWEIESPKNHVTNSSPCMSSKDMDVTSTLKSSVKTSTSIVKTKTYNLVFTEKKKI